jgi:hypothetical protein
MPVALWVRAALNVDALRSLRLRKRWVLAIGLSVEEAPSTAHGRTAVGRARIRMSCLLILFLGLNLTGLGSHRRGTNQRTNGSVSGQPSEANTSIDVQRAQHDRVHGQTPQTVPPSSKRGAIAGGRSDSEGA